MKTYKIITCVFLFTSMFTQACQKDDETQGNPTPVPPEEEVPSSEFNYIYNQGTDGFELYRIPAIVKSKSNTLLALSLIHISEPTRLRRYRSCSQTFVG